MAGTALASQLLVGVAAQAANPACEATRALADLYHGQYNRFVGLFHSTNDLTNLSRAKNYLKLEAAQRSSYHVCIAEPWPPPCYYCGGGDGDGSGGDGDGSGGP